MRVVLITGSRLWSAYPPIEAALAGAEMLIVGDAKGADAIALEIALRWDIITHVYCASPQRATALRRRPDIGVHLVSDWGEEPQRAGILRNIPMVHRAVLERDEGMDVQCFAAPLEGSRGTFHCAKELRKHGFDVHWLRAA